MNKRILFVDDERQIRKAMKRLFAHTEYDLLIADGGVEALEILKTETVDMMITDMRMPEMGGDQLLCKVRHAYPDIIRVALSGYTDKNIVLSVLDNNLAKIYMFKPWDNDKIMEILDGLFKFEDVLRDNKVIQFIKELDNFPTLPDLYVKVTKMVEEEKTVGQIAQVIEEDQAIASRILRISNSAYYGAKTGDIQQAIMFIGLANVKNIILSTAVFGQGGPNMRSLKLEFKHSSLTNRLINQVYNKILKETLPNEAHSAGLLHNIGKGVLLMNMEENIYAAPEDLSVLEKEDAFFGVNHQHVGGYLLNWWELPLPIVEAAMYHHKPLAPEIINKQLVGIVHLAQYYAWALMGEESEEELYLQVFEALNIAREDLEQMVAEMDVEQ